MSAYVIKKYKFELDKLKNRIGQIMTNEKQWTPATSQTPNAVWSDISDVIDESFIDKLSQSIGTELYDVFWVIDYKEGKELKIHKDHPGNDGYSILPRFTCIMMLEGTFEVPIWDDDKTTLLDTAVINPGEILVLNFCEYFHSGKVIDGNKLSLHFYPKIEKIDGPHKNQQIFGIPEYKLNVEDYV